MRFWERQRQARRSTRWLLLVFGLCVWFWLARPVEAFPPTLGDALWVVLAYNLGGKAVNNFSRRGRREGCDDDVFK